MPTFNPPSDDFVVPVIIGEYMDELYLSKESRMANRLGAFIRASGRGRNVFLLSTGGYTDRQPSDYSIVSKVYYGGHENSITADEAASLTAAGYGAYIS